MRRSYFFTRGRGLRPSFLAEEDRVERWSARNARSLRTSSQGVGSPKKWPERRLVLGLEARFASSWRFAISWAVEARLAKAMAVEARLP